MSQVPVSKSKSSGLSGEPRSKLLDLVDEIGGPDRLVTAVAEDIRRLNALRNGLAHSFFPENLKKSKPVWMRTIFTVEAVKAFNEDMERIFSFFLGVKWSSSSQFSDL